MTRNSFAFAAVITLFLCAASQSLAANLFWEGKTGSEAGTLDSNWDVGITANWNLNTEAGAMTVFTNGDNVTFKDDGGGNNDNPNVVIAAGGVSPASITFNRGFGFTYNISGGDILTGSISGIRDDTKNFTRDGSYSFSGGVNITAGGSNFNYSPASPGTYNFGTGTITLSNGSFNFNPGAAATLTNNFILNGGSVTGNANASFSGNLTVGGALLNAPQNSTFVFPSITVTQPNTTINLDRCCSTAPAVQFNSNITGGAGKSIILASGSGNADWTSRIGAPSGSWDVQNITKTNRGRLQFDANDQDDFFSGLKANGGTFFMRGGTVEFRNAAGTPQSSFNLDFPMLFNPDPAFVGPGALQTGVGFFNTSTLNVNNGGVLGGNGTVARASGLGGFNPTFDANMNIIVNNGGQLSPGLSVGLLNIKGNVVLNSGSEILIEVTGGGGVAGVDYDRLNVQGAITGLSNADLVVDFTDVSYGDVLGDVLTIITSTNDLSSFSFNSVTLIAPFSADITFGNGFITLSNFVVPEPTTLALLGLGGLGLVWQGRRRRVRSN